MIRGEDFVYYGPEVWQSMWRNRHQLLSRLARANRVVYVEPRPYIEQITGGLRAGELHVADLWRDRGLAPALPGLWTYRSPRYAPLGGPPPVRAACHWLRQAAVRRDLLAMGVREPIVWISTPTQFDARNDLPARLRVYHIVDDYLAYHDLPAERRPRWASLERQLIDWADLVIAVSPELMQSKGGLPQGGLNPKFRLLPNAVAPCLYADDRPLGPAPELEGLPRPVLGYVGLVSVRLDLALLDELAARHPEWTLVLMGTVFRSGCGELLDRLAARPNVRLLPPVPAERVPDYVRRFDVALAPYRVTQETVHASPLKIYEYLAAGLPVVAADVPGARQFADVLALADTADAWEGAMVGQLGATSAEARAARRRAVAPHTWDARVETLSSFLAEALGRAGPADA